MWGYDSGIFGILVCMKITLVTTGSPHLVFAKQGIDEYLKRINRFADVTVVHVKEDKKTTSKILDLCKKTYCVVVDERGKRFSSQQLALFLETQNNNATNLSFVIGGPDGHVPEVYARADMLWSLSDLTFPHDIAMMLVMETLYRSSSINAGHPYHRD